MQKFPIEAALLDTPFAKTKAGSSREEAMKAAPMRATCDSGHKANGSISKLLGGRHDVASCFCLHLSLIVPSDTLGVGFLA